jgi:hypothetical protein
MRRILRLTLLPLAVLTVVLALSGCGGGDSDANPQQVLDDALGGGTGADSGVLDLNLDVESKGGQAGSIKASVKGPFQSGGTDSLPQIDLDVTAAVDSGGAGGNLDFKGGLTLTQDGAFVGLDGQEYQLDDATFQAVKSSYEKSAAANQSNAEGGSLEQFGIDPKSWVTDLSNEGTEQLDGTEVVHISGTADLPKIVADLNDAAQQTGGAQQLDPSALKGLEDTVSDSTIDVYAAVDDDSLRKFELHLTLADPRGGSGEVTVDLSVGISDPGGDQSIAAPTDAQPLADLLSQIPGGAAALGLGSAGSTGTSGSTNSGSQGSVSNAANKYYDCVAKAKNAQAVNACAAQLGG